MFGMTSYYLRLPPALGVEGYNATTQTVILSLGTTRLATDFPRSLSAGVVRCSWLPPLLGLKRVCAQQGAVNYFPQSVNTHLARTAAGSRFPSLP